MAVTQQSQHQRQYPEMSQDFSESGGSDPEYDSVDDPTYTPLEQTHANSSNLSINTKSKGRISIVEDVDLDSETDGEEEVAVPPLNQNDAKSYEHVHNMIQDKQIEKLKVEQCKLYLRKNGLRLTGNKDTLLKRIKEHLEVVNGGGEKKYPASSFVLNCKGDACTGDVVMFEQNVYEMFDIASRTGRGPPCGTRIVAGRIVKESYGAAKQQHTFTIEVLWSKGEKRLPPLHPLLIKGRNLYRLKTLRQRWEDEGERQKALMEKHSRGSLARYDREARVQKKEMKKTMKTNRISRKEQTKNQSQLNSTSTSKSSVQPHQSCPLVYPTNLHQPFGVSSYETVMKLPSYNEVMGLPAPPPKKTSQRQPLTSVNHSLPATSTQGQKQVCRHYPQGRCYYGENCKFSHEIRENYSERTEERWPCNYGESYKYSYQARENYYQRRFYNPNV